MTDGFLLVGVIVLATLGWAYLFLKPAAGLWTRTWLVAGVLSIAAVGTLAIEGDLDSTLGPVEPGVIAAGVGIGAAWLVATHVGHAVCCRLLPGFLDRVTELYALRTGDRVATMVGPVVAMAVAEELVFRGVVQGSLGVLGGVLVYGAVQLVARNWALTAAALLGGAVWGLLAWWTRGLLAPVLAHLIWTGTLTFVWPLRGCGDEPGGADAAPTARDHERRPDQARAN